MRMVSLSDLAAGWRPMDCRERTICETLLGRAEAIVDSECRKAGIDVRKLDTAMQGVYTTVVCDMVQRAMDNAKGLTTSAVYGEMDDDMTWDAPAVGGWLRMTREQMAMMGITGATWSIQAVTRDGGRHSRCD